jgi:cytochrome d ubiquinol oxidase subunit I
MPVLLLVAQGLAIRRRDPVLAALAARWSKAFGVLFAVGAVSGTVLSFELGLLWPGLMGRYGAAIGVPFTLEAFAFFLEAVFVGIWLYGWDKLSPWKHWWCGVPIAVSGAASAWFVTAVNAWMNAPSGMREEGGRVVDFEPFAPLVGPTALVQATHMLVAAYVVTGFLVASVYAVHLLRGGGAYHRRGMALGLAMGASLAPVQFVVGDWAARVVADTQPTKLAAMEGQFAGATRAPLRLGGLPDETARTTRFAVEVPGGLSWLAYGDADAHVAGVDDVAPDLRPPVAVTHFAFQAMVGSATALLGLAAWTAWRRLRRMRAEARIYLRCVAVGGPLALVALYGGWIVTEVGRQPWTVQGKLRTVDAVTTLTGVPWLLAASVAIYVALTAGAYVVLRHLAAKPLPEDARGA